VDASQQAPWSHPPPLQSITQVAPPQRSVWLSQLFWATQKKALASALLAMPWSQLEPPSHITLHAPPEHVTVVFWHVAWPTQPMMQFDVAEHATPLVQEPWPMQPIVQLPASQTTAPFWQEL
jgi:hypothetical protein